MYFLPFGESQNTTLGKMMINKFPVGYAIVCGLALSLGCSFGSSKSGVKGSDAIFVDERDGHSYSVAILKDGRKWMLDNLDYESPASSYYADAETGEYGRLYPWNEAMNVCPEGWKLPSDTNWNEMIKFYGDASNSLMSERPEGQFERSKTAFLALQKIGFIKTFPGGKKYGYDFSSGGSRALFWSSTEAEGGFFTMDGEEFINENAIFYLFNNENGALYRNSNRKESLYSCRCVEE
ncbi:MAG: hypothetical protein GYB31_09415 [Bacteroidetes bacterium]|nr:hypothetical protein [Bacteroidota bacterium]